MAMRTKEDDADTWRRGDAPAATPKEDSSGGAWRRGVEVTGGDGGWRSRVGGKDKDAKKGKTELSSLRRGREEDKKDEGMCVVHDHTEETVEDGFTVISSKKPGKKVKETTSAKVETKDAPEGIKLAKSGFAAVGSRKLRRQR
ncbi:unnamed protein product [Amoebophrya sp. A25]|nr:unnamed protein product [Amoebophrya sp. A25]|eukprot:GSA25T00022514001.1